jgi:hypothetical protein
MEYLSLPQSPVYAVGGTVHASLISSGCVKGQRTEFETSFDLSKREMYVDFVVTATVLTRMCWINTESNESVHTIGAGNLQQLTIPTSLISDRAALPTDIRQGSNGTAENSVNTLPEVKQFLTLEALCSVLGMNSQPTS